MSDKSKDQEGAAMLAEARKSMGRYLPEGSMSECQHDLAEIEAAAFYDKLCPLCQRDEIARLRAALHRYGEHDATCDGKVMDPCNCGLLAALQERHS